MLVCVSPRLLDVTTLLPAGIALLGVLLGLSVQRNWNHRVERLKAYTDFSVAFNKYWDDLIDRNQTPQEDLSADATAIALELFYDVYRQATLVQIVGNRAVAAVAKALEVPSNDSDTLMVHRNLFIHVTRMDTTLNVVEKFRLRRQWWSVQRTEWFKDEIAGRSDKAWWR